MSLLCQTPQKYQQALMILELNCTYVMRESQKPPGLERPCQEIVMVVQHVLSQVALITEL